MTRFMLNLQAVDNRNRHHSSTFGGTESHGEGNGSLFFQRVIGSIGSRGIEDTPMNNMEPNNDEEEEYGEGRSTIAEENHNGGLSANMQSGAAADGAMEEGRVGLVTEPDPERQRDIQTIPVTA